MNVGYFLIVTICVSQSFRSTVGLKLPLSNISTKSSPTLKSSTSASNTALYSSPFAANKFTSVKKPISISNLENTFNSPKFNNEYPPTSLASSSASLPNVFNINSADALKLESSESGNSKRNSNILATIQNSLIKQKNNFIPSQSSSITSIEANESSKNAESSIEKKFNENILSSFSNKVPFNSFEQKTDYIDKLSSLSNVETLSNNEISPSIFEPNSLQNYLQQSSQNQDPLSNNNKLRQNSPRFLDSVSMRSATLTDNNVNNLASSYAGQLKNINDNIVQDINPFPRNIGSLQSNVLTNVQNIENPVSNRISTQNPTFNPSSTISPNSISNNLLQSLSLNQASSALIENNVNKGSLLPDNLANKIISETKSESAMSITNPYKSFTSSAQSNMANRSPISINNNLISNLQQFYNNGYENTILNNDFPVKNTLPNSRSLNSIQNNEAQFKDIESYLQLQNLLTSRAIPDTAQNALPINTIIGQNNLIENNKQNLLSNDVFINNANIQTPIISLYNNPNIQNAADIQSALRDPRLFTDVTAVENGASILLNTLPNVFTVAQPNNYNCISQISTPISSYFPEATPLYPDISASNILQQPNHKSSPQLNTFPSNNLVNSPLLQAFNPMVELQSPNILPETLNINTGSYLPTSNLDLINRLNILENIRPETLFSPTYPGNYNNLNSISQLSSLPQLTLPQNTNVRSFDLAPQLGLNCQQPINKIMEVAAPSLNLNSNPYLPPNPLEIYNYLYPPIITDTSSYTNTISTETVSDNQEVVNNSIDSTESIKTTTETSSIINNIPTISDLPNVLASNYLTLPQALLYNQISPSNLVVPRIENLISTNDLTKSIIDLGNDVARQWIDNLWAKKAQFADSPLYDSVFPLSSSVPPIAETFVPTPYISPPVIPMQSPSLIVPPSVVSISPPVIDTVIEVDQSNQFVYPSLSTTRFPNEEPQRFFRPTLFATDVSVYSPSVLPTPIINYPVYSPYIPTPSINFPPIPPLFPPMPSIFETPILKMGSGGQDSRKFIEILLLASLLNNNDCCKDRGGLETLIALMLAT